MFKKKDTLGTEDLKMLLIYHEMYLLLKTDFFKSKFARLLPNP